MPEMKAKTAAPAKTEGPGGKADEENHALRELGVEP
jgi:hypothetical protein